MTVDWRGSALCAQVDTEIFFLDKGDPPAPAKRICAACPVRVDCLTEALDRNEPYGIWGGLAPRERQRLRLDTGRLTGRPLRIARMYRQGLTVAEIGGELGLSETTVRADLDRAGVPRRDDRLRNGRRTA